MNCTPPFYKLNINAVTGELRSIHCSFPVSNYIPFTLSASSVCMPPSTSSSVLPSICFKSHNNSGFQPALPFFTSSCVMVANSWPSLISHQLLSSSVCQTNNPPSQISRKPDCFFVCVTVNEERTHRDKSPDVGNLSVDRRGHERETESPGSPKHFYNATVDLAGRKFISWTSFQIIWVIMRMQPFIQHSGGGVGGG